jgi:hypothetical protein
MTSSPDDDGRHDFDFIHGSWAIQNRKLKDMTDPACTAWVEFATTSSAHPIFGGLSHLDRIIAGPDAPGGPWEGLTLRQFDPTDKQWRIWWASSRNPGHLDPPLTGSFHDGIGTFYGDDVLAGTPIRIRFRWTTSSPDQAEWSQEFSYDEGRTWYQNWTMSFTRRAE